MEREVDEVARAARRPDSEARIVSIGPSVCTVSWTRKLFRDHSRTAD